MFNKLRQVTFLVGITLLSWVTGSEVYGQCAGIAITATATPPSICAGSSQLNALASGTFNYHVTPITFAPVAGVGTALVLGDDQVSAAVPIGFTFNFFGLNYTNAYISSNGFLTFDGTSGSGCCTGGLMPTLTNPYAVIAPAWEDLYPPGGGTIDYFTTGVTPNQVFVARWTGVPHYGSANLDQVTMEIQLYETTNYIEIHITTMPGNPNGTWLGHTEGIQDATSAVAYTVPGRNSDATWTATNDAYRFYIYDYAWTPTPTLNNPAIPDPIATPLVTTIYTVTATDGAGCTISAPVTVSVSGAAPTISASGPTTFCTGGSVTLTASSGSSYLWSNGATTQSITVSTSGSFTVQVGGCTTPSSATVVTVNANPAIPTITAGGPLTFCVGGSVTLTSTAGTTYLWSDGSTTQSINVTTAGTFTVTVSNASGCTAISAGTTTIVNPAQTVTVTSSATPTSVCAGQTSQLTASGTSNGFNNYTVTSIPFNPLPGVGTAEPLADDAVFPAAPLNFNFDFFGVTYTDAYISSNGFLSFDPLAGSGCCTGGLMPTLANPFAVVAAAWEDLNSNDGGTIDYFTTGVTPNQVFVARFTAVAHYGSSGLDPVTMQIQLYETTNNIEIHITSMPGNANGFWSGHTEGIQDASSAVAYTVPGRNSDATWTATNDAWLFTWVPNTVSGYTWTPTPTLSNPNISNPVATPVATTTYTVIATNTNGCTGTSTSTVTVTSVLPTITAGGPTTFCAGGSVVLTASAGTSYLWSTGATTQSITATTAGSYTCTVTTGGCTGTSTPIVVTISSPPTTITASGPVILCSGGSVTLTSTAGISYLWSTGATTQAITVGTAGNYSVTTTYAGGCTSTSTVTTVTVNPAPTVSVTASGPTTFCNGGSVTLTSTVGNSYLWSSGATTQSISVTTSGNYSVTLTDANGCTAVSSVTSVTVNPAPQATITASGPTTFCTGGNVVLTATAGTSYLWSTGATSQSIIATTSGSYVVVVTYSAGCSSTSTATTITVNTTTPASITASGPTTICQGGNVTLVSSSGNSFLWSTGATTSFISVTMNGNYSVTVTDAGGCTSTSPVTTVTVNPTPSTAITASGPTTICQGQTVMLTAAVAAGYLWNNGATTQSIVVSTSGNYNVTLTSAQGCTATSVTTQVTVNPNASASITASGPTTICPGQNLTLTANSGTSYIWSTGATSQSITVNTTGVYTVTVTNSSGCTAISNAVSVTVGTMQASVTTSGPTTFCQGGNVSLMANAGLSYLWSSGQTTQSIFATNPGTYTVTVTYPGGCTSTSAPTIVVINPAPVSTISPSQDVNFCLGDSITLTATGTPGTYSWNTGAISQTITAYAAGIYTVSVTDANSCYASSSITLTSYTAPVAGFTSSVTWATASFVDLSTNALSYYWTFGDGNSSNIAGPTHHYYIDNTYTVMQIVTNPCGSDTSIQTVVITTTGIPTNMNDVGVYIYPNPVSEDLNILINESDWKQTNIILTDMLGKSVYSEVVENPGIHFEKQVSVKTFAPGIYFLNVRSGEVNLVKKVVVE